MKSMSEVPEFMRPVVDRYPPGTIIIDKVGEKMYVVGLAEPTSGKVKDVGLMLSKTNPREDYEGATESYIVVLASKIDEVILEVTTVKVGEDLN